MLRMQIGIGRPAAVPDTDMTLLGLWAGEAEECVAMLAGVLEGALA